MGEIKAQLLGIAAVIVTFGIVSSAIFLAFDTMANDLADEITATVEYKSETQTSNFVYKDYVALTENNQLLSF